MKRIRKLENPGYYVYYDQKYSKVGKVFISYITKTYFMVHNHTQLINKRSQIVKSDNSQDHIFEIFLIEEPELYLFKADKDYDLNNIYIDKPEIFL